MLVQGAIKIAFCDLKKLSNCYVETRKCWCSHTVNVTSVLYELANRKIMLAQGAINRAFIVVTIIWYSDDYLQRLSSAVL